MAAEAKPPGEKRPKYRGEHKPVLLSDSLPSNTLAAFSRVIRHKNTELDRVSERSATSYVRNARYFINWLESTKGKSALEADTSDLRVYLRNRKAGKIDGGQGDSDNTITTRRSAISRFYSELSVMAEDGEISVDPSACPANPEDGYDATWRVRKTKKAKQSGDNIQYLKPPEVKRLWENVPAPKVRNRLIVRLLYHTGLRVSEMCHIKVDQIDRQNREITVPPVTSKSDRSCPAPYKDTLDNDLRRWIDGGLRDAEHYAEHSDYLFPTKNSVKISRQAVRVMLKEAAENAGIDDPEIYVDKSGNSRSKIHPHLLRHSMAINTLDAGNLNVRELQEILAHSDLSTTEVYLDIASDDATDKYHETGGPPEG